MNSPDSIRIHVWASMWNDIAGNYAWGAVYLIVNKSVDSDIFNIGIDSIFDNVARAGRISINDLVKDDEDF